MTTETTTDAKTGTTTGTTTGTATGTAQPRSAAARNAPPARGSRRHTIGFWLIAATFLTAMAFSTVPTPLYPLYQHRDGFSTFMITVVFAVYAVGVVVSLMLAGHISDGVGRKRVLLPALALEAVAAVLFLVWPALPGLIVARFVTGLGVGMITATATAHLHELHSGSRPGAGHGRFEVVSTAANIGGLGVGPLVAGFLAQFVTEPLRTPYAVFAILLLLGIAAVAAAPETVAELPQRPAWRPQTVSAPSGDRAGYLAAVVSGFSAFAVFGLFTSLAPAFVGGTLHHPSRLLAGVTVFLVFGAAALAQSATSRMTAGTRLATGLLGEAAGVVVLAMGMRESDLAAFLIGGALAGAGAGVLFKSAVGTVVRAAAPAQRGSALAGLFLISYLGLIVPAIGLGIATRSVPATTAMLWFTGALLVVMTAAALLARTARRTASKA
ncbi:MFS transporter [Streptomyces sp. NBC_01476]|uniref:MFS transporter n=1 Tax=Streptomyces sp. NBC_01476 TaxID=2903881 RepID=UPI002E3598DF|nr:MFS transporter [Streptomyces sp. NBC_01476]